MVFEVSVLASGSSGNAAYVRAGSEHLLFDAGLSRSTLFDLMARRGIDPRKIGALFLSHEHHDHIRGMGAMHRALAVPLYSTQGTLENGASLLGDLRETFEFFEGGSPRDLEKIELGNAVISPLRVPHDAADPVNFVVAYKGKRMGIFIDLGHPTEAVRSAFSTVQCAILEANHSLDMLWNGPYPLALKQRIASPTGHLSNEEAASLMIEHAAPDLACVFIAHRSLHNNTADLAMRTLDHARTALLAKGHPDLALLHTARSEPTALVRVGHPVPDEARRIRTEDPIGHIRKAYRTSRKPMTLLDYGNR